MPGTTVTLDTPDGPMRAYEATPDAGTPHHAVVVIQEAFGLNAHIEDVTRRLGAEGYHAIAPALFHRSGDPVLGYDDLASALPEVGRLTDDGQLVDVDAVLARLREAGWATAQIGIIGFCMGGRTSFLATARRPLGAGVGFYGGGIVHGRSEQSPSLVGELGTMAAPWLGLFGDRDDHIPVAEVEELASAAKDTARVPVEIVRYPEAGHAFHCDARASHHPPSAADAWQRSLAWFDRHLG